MSSAAKKRNATQVDLAPDGYLAYASAYTKEAKTMPQPSPAPRHVRLFRNNRNQAIRIPVEFELPGSEAIISRDGDRLIIQPVRKGNLLALLASWGPLDEAFPDVDATLQPLGDVNL
jgi:antitoxin VapB